MKAKTRRGRAAGEADDKAAMPGVHEGPGESAAGADRLPVGLHPVQHVGGGGAQPLEVLREDVRRQIDALPPPRRLSAIRRLLAASGGKPKLLDLCCKAGGASAGYARAGFDVTGVDISDQPNYRFRFDRCDAMKVCLDGFDVVHVSPPCQMYSRSRRRHPEKTDAEFQDLLAAFRERLEGWGGIYVIENVEGAPVKRERSILLCGRQFGLKTYRHRVFESNVMLMGQPHPVHRKKVARTAEEIDADPDAILNPVGHFTNVPRHMAAVGIDWRMTREELAEAIPPAYTLYLGLQLQGILSNRSEQ